MIQNEPFSGSVIAGVLRRAEVEYMIFQRRICTCFRTGSIGASFLFGALLVGGIGLPIMASATSTTASCGSSSHLHSRAALSALSIRFVSSSRELCSIKSLFLFESCFERSIEFFCAAQALWRAIACRSVSVKRTSLDQWEALYRSNVRGTI